VDTLIKEGMEGCSASSEAALGRRPALCGRQISHIVTSWVTCWRRNYPNGIGELSSGTVNISLEVEDAGAAAALLRERGTDVRDAVSDSWGTAVDVVDPDGYIVSLFQRPA